jgi:hypothetical protein
MKILLEILLEIILKGDRRDGIRSGDCVEMALATRSSIANTISLELSFGCLDDNLVYIYKRKRIGIKLGIRMSLNMEEEAC